MASIKHARNPGDLRLTAGEGYRIIGKNRDDASHYLIQLDRTPPAQRWVPVTCGRLDPNDHTSITTQAGNRTTGISAQQPTEAGAAAPPGRPHQPPQQLMLAASWQSAFCTFSARRPECKRLDAGDAAAERFSLHGLWPQPIGNSYCGVSDQDRHDSQRGDWQDLPRLDLTTHTRARLEDLMPGTRSQLQRHQWTKHGSCYGTDTETYFDDALDLLQQLNASPVRTLFADNLGKHLRASEIRATFSRAFGGGAGTRVRLQCKDGLITELRISLRGASGADANLSEWLSAAPPKSGGCRGGRVANR